MGRILCIGDQHGGFKAVKQVLERCNFNYLEDKLINLGDVCDGWSETAQLVQFWIEFKEKCKHEPIFLRGNHDKWCEDWLLTGSVHPYWLDNGGNSTRDSYINNPVLMVSDEHKKFFRNLHNYYIDEENRGFVHGGFISRKGLGHEPYQATYYWDRDLWNLALMSDGRVHEGPENYRRFEKHKEIYIGHTSTENWKCKPHYLEWTDDLRQRQNAPITIPMNRCNVWNVDTGGGFGGKLTVLDIDTKEFWQSDFVKDLYPDEKGR